MTDDPTRRGSVGEGVRPGEAIEVIDAGVVGDEASGFESVHGLRLRHPSGIEATLLTYGAGLAALRVPNAQRPGELVEITRPHTDLASLQTIAGRFVGATVGRVANRITGASFDLDGITYRLDPNEPPNQLHGGTLGFHARVWAFEILDDAVGVRFSLTSDDGDGGYPGTVRAEAVYRLSERQLEIEYRASTDAPTPINLANHAYWNLAGPDGDPTVDGHRLRVELDRVVLVDDAGLPVSGPPVEVARTRFDVDGSDDLRATLASGGLDHCYVGSIDVSREAVVLEHLDSGRRLSISTNQPGVQVYTGQHFVPPHQAIAFEPEMWPDSPNRPDFPSAVLRPGETYLKRSVYRFDW